MILFPIPAIFIIMILIAIFGGIEAIDDFFSMNTLKSIMEAVPMIVALILIAVCIKISFDNLEEKEGWEGLSKVYKVLLVAFLPIGAIIYYELYSMDVNKNCFGSLGKYVPSPLLALLVSYIIITVLFVIINHTKESWITSACCAFQVIAIVAVYLVSANVCTSSYAAGAAKELIGDEVIQYVVVEPVKARYPSYPTLRSDREKFAPTFFPLKWVAANFKEGDIVYSDKDSTEEKTILVSDGERSGYVDASCLEKCEKKFQYALVVNNREEKAPLYEKGYWSTEFLQETLSSDITQYLEPGESVKKIDSGGGMGFGLDYIKVETESGAQGYLPSRYVDVVKMPVASQ